MYEDRTQVCEQFISECASKIVLIPNLNLDNKTKFSLIRNKLAHGDFAYDEDRDIIRLDDFRKIFNFDNMELVMEQDRKVNRKK